ncbi:type II CAAX endopeptidase family protein [Streptomyces caniscabiei]|uniref:CPBP family intramembrane glutamic endopeptidase n=1 Tax=Streptomyces caniscabiei TaxID=2746961 RepID=UPI0029B3F07E|nr:type II CAAX endopeptidase family protein [Streptomyces caniscabiei]MDX2776219.1 type II CAAX endopeptidase family protein [Streptomyces caniscabiei]
MFGIFAGTLQPWQKAIILSFWVLASFFVAQLVVVAVFLLLELANVTVTLNQAVLQSILAAVVYVLTLGILIGLPWLLKGRRTSRQDVGLTGLLTWADLGLGPAGFVVYLLASAAVVSLIGALIPAFDASQVQNTGFEGLSLQYEYLLAFVTLVVLAPVAEEVLFRGYLYGKLRKTTPTWIAILITSALFGLVHFQWNVGIDVFVLSVVACVLREVTGTIWAGILLHMIKNGLAFYFLFINTTFLVQ